MRSVLRQTLLATVVFCFAHGAAQAAATAQGVALNAGAGCDNADLDLTLTTVNAHRELGLITNAAGATLGSFEQSSGLSTFSGTFVGYGQPVSPTQPPNTLIGS